jgi:hypothetical protein
MNCEDVQERLLLADDPVALAAGGGEVAAHVAGCAVCGAFVAKLGRLEGAVRAMPVPADSERAKRAAVEWLRLEGRPVRRLLLRPMWAKAVAAVVVIGVGVGLLVYLNRPSPATAAPQVVDRLLDWDLALADAEAPQERQALYVSQAATLSSAVERAPLNEEDRRFAATLLQNGEWLSQHHDPVERTEKFCDLADLLVGRLDKAAKANDARAVQRLGKHFGRVQKGIGTNLERLGANAYVGNGPAAKRAERLERIARRQEEAERRLAALAERSPRAAAKALRRLMEKRSQNVERSTSNAQR